MKTTSMIALFAGAAVAQNSTSLPGLVSQLPPCAISCFDSAAGSANCQITDFECLCGTGREAFISSVGPCIFLSAECSQDERSSATTLAGQICAEVSTNPDPTEVASASSIVASAVGSETASPTDNAAARPDVRLGIAGLGALAAFVL